jgi:uncharacterized damage-inducible protein DinB
MLYPQALARMFAYSFNWLNANRVGLTDEEAFQFPIRGGNNLNWLLGHIVSSRSRVLEILRQQPVWDEVQRAPYRSGSQPVSGLQSGVLPIEAIWNAYDLSQQRIAKGFQQITFEELAHPSGFAENTYGDSLAYFHFHETFHMGEISALLQALGRQPDWIFS